MTAPACQLRVMAESMISSAGGCFLLDKFKEMMAPADEEESELTIA